MTAALSFLLPFMIMLLGFACAETAPFGPYAPMAGDGRSQYFPFQAELRRFVRSGELPLWRWAGGGTNYIALIAYYLASPVNWIACLLPEAWLSGFYLACACARIAAAGAAMAWFLRKAYGGEGFASVAAGCSFSFCTFLMGYGWNVIWLDTIALTPVVAYGALRLMRDGKFRLYFLSLFASLWCNFYIGFFTCIFVLLEFIGYHVLAWDGLRPFLRRLRRMAAWSALAIGAAAVLLLPAYLALGNSYALEAGTPDLSGMNFLGGSGPLSFLANMAMALPSLADMASPATVRADAPPNAGCGLVALLLYIMFLLDRRFRRRERILSLGLVLLMFASCVIRVLDYIWHGFHFTNMIPYRFAYLICFVVIAGAYREYRALDGTEMPALKKGLIALFVLADGALMVYGPASCIAGFAGFALLACVLLPFEDGKMPRGRMAACLGVLVLVQSCFMSVRGMDVMFDLDELREEYPAREADLGAVADRLASEDGGWRACFVRHVALNDSALYGIPGIDTFASTANGRFALFLKAAGTGGYPEDNRWQYAQGSPVSDLVLGVRYLVAADGRYRDRDCLSAAGRYGDAVLLENDAWLPAGFMADRAVLGWDAGTFGADVDPFAAQEDLFLRLSGIGGSLWHYVEPSSFAHSGGEADVSVLGPGSYGVHYYEPGGEPLLLDWTYEIPEDGEYYIRLRPVRNGAWDIHTEPDVFGYEDLSLGIRCLGRLEAGDRIAVHMEAPETPSGDGVSYEHTTLAIRLARLDGDAWAAGRDALMTRAGLEGVSRTGTGLSGTISVPEAGLLFTAMPYEPGWKAYVDGGPAEILLAGESAMCLELDEGNHDIRFRYLTPGLVPGIAASLICWGVFALACRADRKQERGDAPERRPHGIGRDTGV